MAFVGFDNLNWHVLQPDKVRYEKVSEGKSNLQHARKAMSQVW